MSAPRTRAAIDPASIRRILVVKMSAIGDVVQALPVASALKRRYPSASITWAAENWTAAVLRGHPAIDRVVRLPRMSYASALAKPRSWLAEFRAAARELQRESYDVALDLQGLLKSSIVMLLSRSKVRLGIEGQREGAALISRTLPTRAPHRHAVMEYLAAAKSLDAPIDHVEFGLRPQPEATASVMRMLAGAANSSRALVVINPSPSAERKRWPDERWISLLDQLDADLAVVLAGGAEHRERHASIARAAARQPLDLTGRTSLEELIALLSMCAVHVAPDTGSAHIAAALGRPVVGIYGPTAAWRLGPWRQDTHLLDGGALCGATCPRVCAHGRRCILSISARQVADKISEALQPQAAQSDRREMLR